MNCVNFVILCQCKTPCVTFFIFRLNVIHNCNVIIFLNEDEISQASRVFAPMPCGVSMFVISIFPQESTNKKSTRLFTFFLFSGAI